MNLLSNKSLNVKENNKNFLKNENEIKDEKITSISAILNIFDEKTKEYQPLFWLEKEKTIEKENEVLYQEFQKIEKDVILLVFYSSFRFKKNRFKNKI